MSKRRLIDVDKALNDINNIGFYTGKMSDGDYCEEIVNIIQNAPTVEERKHGHWVRQNGEVFCSVCWTTDEEVDRFLPRFDYCPYCGAIMDEVTE